MKNNDTNLQLIIEMEGDFDEEFNEEARRWIAIIWKLANLEISKLSN